jgi:hypothetical protein
MGTIKTTNIEPIADNGTVTLGSSGDTFQTASGVLSRLGVFESQLLHVRDEKGTTVGGGTSLAYDGSNYSSGVQTRTLNTIKTNEITGASLSSNQITLPAGTYYIHSSVPGQKVGNSHHYLYNVTDTSNTLTSTTGGVPTSIGITLRSEIYGRFTINSSKVFEIKHFTRYAFSTFGLGEYNNIGTFPSVYTEVKIWRTA